MFNCGSKASQGAQHEASRYRNKYELDIASKEVIVS